MTAGVCTVRPMDDEAEKRQGILSWLGSTGYPLEFMVGRTLAAQGYTVRHGVHFIDEHDGVPKTRETDVVAAEPNTRNDNRILVVAECKRPTRSWLVFCTRERVGPEAFVQAAIADRTTKSQLLGELDRIDTRREPVPFMFQVSPLLGFSLKEGPVQGKRGDKAGRLPGENVGSKDLAYEAIQSVATAARALTANVSVFGSRYAVFPVIVTDTTLWTVEYDRDGNMDARTADWHRIYWQGAPGGEPVIVDVVTKQRLPVYARDLRADTMWLANWMDRQPSPYV